MAAKNNGPGPVIRRVLRVYKQGDLMGLESRIQRLEREADASCKHVIAIREPGDQYRVGNRNYTAEEFERFKVGLTLHVILHIVEVGF